MEKKEKGEGTKRRYTMRSLHRDIGFFVIGITIIYGLSGILLVYRDTGLLKSEKVVEKTIQPNLKASQLGAVMHVRAVKVVKEEGDVIYFQNGNYNAATGELNYTANQLPSFLNKLNQFHKTSSRNVVHYISIIYAVLLLFLAISSFWMYKPKSNMFKRGLYLTGAGLVLAILLLLI